MLRKVFPCCVSVLIIILLSSPYAQAQSPSQPSPKTQQLTPVVPAPEQISAPNDAGALNDLSYRIGPGDELDVRIFGRSELSRIVRVDSYGRIRLPFLEDVQAACMTEAQLAESIAEKYKKYLRDPQVDVMIKDFRSQPVAVIGAVSQPGRFQLQRRIRLLELLSFAGGPNTHAGGTVHIIHNSEHDHCSAASPEPKPADGNGEGASILPLLSSIKLKQVMAGTPDANPYVQPGDIVSIPEADQIFVTGSVVKPGAYPLLTRITLTQAVALAGGVNMEAARGKVRLIRQDEGTETRKETVYNLDDIHRRKIQDILLLPNDIIEVPSSTMRVASRNMLGVSINMLSALPYFIIR